MTTYPLDDTYYDAGDVAIYNATRSSGVYAGNDFNATADGTNNKITVAPGLAWMHIGKFKGLAIAQTEYTSLDMDIPDAMEPRIDAVILRFDANANETTLTVKRGTPESSPKPPERITTEAVYELHLYHVLRNPSDTAVMPKSITDVRLQEEWCGLMADAVTTVDTAAIAAQVQGLIDELRAAVEQAVAGEIPDNSITPEKLTKAYLPVDGGTLLGPLKLTAGVHYGTTPPASAEEGQVFFIVEE